MYTNSIQIIVNTGKIGLWVLLPLLLFSNTEVAYRSPMNAVVENGSYNLTTAGIFENTLSGQIVYNEKVDFLVNRKSVKRLELELNYGENSSQHHLGFVISKQLSDSGDLIGSYDVKAKVAGFTSLIDGVFGFADVPILGEQPYYAYNGAIEILDVKKDLVRGEIDVTLRNFEGQNIELSGSFIAARRK